MGRGKLRYGHVALREFFFVIAALAGAWLFFNHGLLYLEGSPVAGPVSPVAFAVTMAILYGFLRSVVFVASVRPPTARDGRAVCPECGRPLAGNPDHDRAREERSSVLPATEAEVRAVLALRRTVESAKGTARAIRAAERSFVPGDLVNPPARIPSAFVESFGVSRPGEAIDTPPAVPPTGYRLAKPVAVPKVRRVAREAEEPLGSP